MYEDIAEAEMFGFLIRNQPKLEGGLHSKLNSITVVIPNIRVRRGIRVVVGSRHIDVFRNLKTCPDVFEPK